MPIVLCVLQCGELCDEATDCITSTDGEVLTSSEMSMQLWIGIKVPSDNVSMMHAGWSYVIRRHLSRPPTDRTTESCSSTQPMLRGKQFTSFLRERVFSKNCIPPCICSSDQTIDVCQGIKHEANRGGTQGDICWYIFSLSWQWFLWSQSTYYWDVLLSRCLEPYSTVTAPTGICKISSLCNM